MNPLNYKVDLQDTSFVRQYMGFLVDDYTLDKQVMNWLKLEAKGEWYFDFVTGKYIKFEKEQDAMLFKLTWGGV